MGRLNKAMTKVKCYELRKQSKTKSDLTKQLDDLKTELTNLRVQGYWRRCSQVVQNQGGAQEHCSCADCFQRDNQGGSPSAYSELKYAPLDLRAKKTRAIRRRLTQHESGKMTKRQ